MATRYENQSGQPCIVRGPTGGTVHIDHGESVKDSWFEKYVGINLLVRIDDPDPAEMISEEADSTSDN